MVTLPRQCRVARTPDGKCYTDVWFAVSDNWRPQETIVRGFEYWFTRMRQNCRVYLYILVITHVHTRAHTHTPRHARTLTDTRTHGLEYSANTGKGAVIYRPSVPPTWLTSNVPNQIMVSRVRVHFLFRTDRLLTFC